MHVLKNKAFIFVHDDKEISFQPKPLKEVYNNVLECLIFIEYSFGYLNDFIFFCSVKPEHYLNTMDFLQAIRETQEKM